MANHGDNGALWRWETLSPRMDLSNGDERASGSIWTGHLSDPLQWYGVPRDCK